MFSLFWPVTIGSVDNSIKKYREEHPEEHDYLDGSVHIQTYHNKGAMLNLGEKAPNLVLMVSVLFTCIIALVFVLTLGKKGKKALKLGLGLLLGGAFSNTYDRLERGYVVDYLRFAHAPKFIRNIVFNISDFAIIIGSLISTICDRD